MKRVCTSNCLVKLMLGFLTCLLCGQATSAPLPKELHLVTGNNFKPWTDQSLQSGGLITEIVQTVFKDVGIKTTVEWLPWKRGYQRVVTGTHNAFGTFPYSYSNTRAPDVYYSIPLMISGLTIFVAKDSPIPKNYEGQSALHGLRFCTGLGYAFDDFTDLIESGKITLLKLANVENCLLNIKAGRADAVVLNKHVGWGMINSMFENKHSFRALKEHKPSVYHLVVNKAHPNTLDILHEFNKSLLKLQKSGVIDDIVNRHMKPQK